jgi:hypothetical protein
MISDADIMAIVRNLCIGSLYYAKVQGLVHDAIVIRWTGFIDLDQYQTGTNEQCPIVSTIA